MALDWCQVLVQIQVGVPAITSFTKNITSADFEALMKIRSLISSGSDLKGNIRWADLSLVLEEILEKSDICHKANVELKEEVRSLEWRLSQSMR